MEIFRAVEKEVHPGDGGCGQVLFLAVELAQHEVLVAAMLFDMMQRLEEHATGPAGRVINGFPGLGRKDANHQRDHGARGIEFTGLLVGQVGKFPDQVFIGLAENVRLAVLITQVERREVFDQVLEQRVRKAILVCPLSVAEDAVQGVRVGLLNAAHGLLERMADIGAPRPNIVPVAALRNLESVIFGELGKFHVAVGLLHGHNIFLVIGIGEPLEEQQRKDVGLEIGRVDRATEDIGRLPEMSGEGPDIQFD
jgi:hypothetical protein